MIEALFSALRNKLGFAPRPVLNSLTALTDFTARQAAYVSQVTLFGYIKHVQAQAGRNYLKMTLILSLCEQPVHISLLPV